MSQAATDNPGAVYGFAFPGRRLSPRKLRSIRFPWTRRFRRGLIAADVYAFLSWMADELEIRDAAELALREENQRLKAALRDWQAEQAAQAYQARNAVNVRPLAPQRTRKAGA
ncbi:MAG TPA: DivIVA domain-containing protein [Micromonosporaceae bacterium]